MIVRSVLGEEREPSKVFPDGSYNCPFCGAAVFPSNPVSLSGVRSTALEEWAKIGYTPTCSNPCCLAGCVTVDYAQEIRAKQEEREQRERDSQARTEAMRRYSEERRQYHQSQLEQAAADGLCVECFRRSYGKRIRHREGNRAYHDRLRNHDLASMT